jgi:predicted enzyme related to lactoylglutathione lyase
MSRPSHRPMRQFPPHGQIGYLQLPATDIARSAAFYETVFGWSVDLEHGSFEAPGLIGQWTTERQPSQEGGPVAWICADELWATLENAVACGGTVRGQPYLDTGERWLADLDDPAGTRIGVVVPVRTARPQPMIAVQKVEASSAWYRQLLGLESAHGGHEYERLLADGVLVLQLHQRETEHHHGLIGDPHSTVGNGVLLWFGDVADFDGVVARAEQLGAEIVLPPHRNPPEGQGNGPAHREIWIKDPDGYTVVIASPDGEAFEPV